MAAHDMWKTTDLLPLLKERGVDLSTVQVYRLVTDKPERLSMKILTALCDILDCTPADLIEPYVEAGMTHPILANLAPLAGLEYMEPAREIVREVARLLQA